MPGFRTWAGRLTWPPLRFPQEAGGWVLCACALLGGRAFGLSGVVAFALGWPMVETRRADSPWNWAALAAAALGTAWSVSLRAALALGIAGAAALALRGLRRARGLPRWIPGAGAAAAVSLVVHPHLGVWPAAALALAQGGLLPLVAVAAAALRAEVVARGGRRSGGRGGAAGAPTGPHLLAAAAAAGICAAGLALSGSLPFDPRALGLTLLGMWLWDPATGARGALAGAVSGWVAALTGGVGAVAPASLALGWALGWGLADGPPWRAAAGLTLGALGTAALAGHGWVWAAGVVLGAGLWSLHARRTAVVAAGGPVPGPGLPPPAPLWLDRLRTAAHACLELSRGLAQVAAAGVDAWQPGQEGLRVAEEVCPGCPSLRTCWERRLPRARRLVDGVWRAAVAGGATWQQVGGPDSLYCLRPREMAAVANRHAALARQREELSRLLAASRRSAVTPLLALGRTLEDLADEVAAASSTGPREREGAGTAVLPPRMVQARWRAAPSPDGCWGYSAVAAAVAKPGRTVSGDAFRCRLLPGDRLALLLCDGMGSGPLAAVAASAAAEHVLAWLAAGRPPADALRLGNERLLEDGDAERFATIDLAVVHLRAALIECFKMGAPASFLCHARGVREFPAGGLPAGILPHPEIRSSRGRLRPGDVVVLLSDGAVDRGGGAPGGRAGRWIHDHLRAEAQGEPACGQDPEGLAASLVGAAVQRMPRDHDDISALVCMLLGPGGPAKGDRRDDAPPGGPGPAGGA